MQLFTKNTATATATLVAVQYFVLASAMPDNDLRAGSPLEINLACPNAQGQLMCSSASALLVCDQGYWRFLSYCPEGTKCQKNQCINAADVTIITSQPVSLPVKQPANLAPTSRTISSLMPTTSPTSNGSQTASIPNITEVPKLPIASSTKPKATGAIPNINTVPELPISDTRTDTLSSSAAGQPSWTRLHMFIPVVSAIAAPCIAMLLF